MLLIGASIVFSFNANSFVGYVEAQNEVVVFLKDNLSDDRISEVEQQLKNTENVSAVRLDVYKRQVLAILTKVCTEIIAKRGKELCLTGYSRALSTRCGIPSTV